MRAVIKNPMDLGTVEQRLKQLAMPCYTGPQMFYEDVMQVRL